MANISACLDAKDRFDKPVLEVKELTTKFVTERGKVEAVRQLSFDLYPGETLAIVGESGSGKTVSSLSLMRLLDSKRCEINGTASLHRRNGKQIDLVSATEDEMDEIRGNDVAMVFQEPMTSLNPVMTVGRQVAEGIVRHERVSKRAAWARAEELLRKVRIPDAADWMVAYPHQLSGGMRQRAMIAMALACDPVVLVADEPTTALDVTVQAQIVDLLKELQAENGMAILFITHNLGVVAAIADRVLVMYAGRAVEMCDVATALQNPLMPYTRGLLQSIPRMAPKIGEFVPLPTIRGSAPDAGTVLPGCSFAPRCNHALHDVCETGVPKFDLVREGHCVRCARWADIT